MPSTTFPPFPDNVPTHPLLVIDYELIKAGDQGEIDRLWQAGTNLGFWYLKNYGVDEEVHEMFAMGSETLALPMEEKMKFEQGDNGMTFGYKQAGANAVDASGKPDGAEFLNIAKDDALAWPHQARRTYPSIVNARMESTITPFVRKSLEVNNTFLRIFEAKLGLPAGALIERHKMDEFSGSEARVIRTSPCPPDKGQLVGSHTDFGSLSFLHNRLGGLQVLVPGAESWQYIKVRKHFTHSH
ncbi:Clavaminate synthase-like protein [Tricholoma matsutake]|nr:Clavaminate synthase-like protein [Tricholoma matsutake 945]KAF8234729.1 Clavaminate synthase-like protein [Tricholoma matsutake 945]